MATRTRPAPAEANGASLSGPLGPGNWMDDAPRVNTHEIPLAQIEPSGANPRKHFDQAKLEELAESIKSKGVLQPILLRRVVAKPKREIGSFTSYHVGRYELVAGERRFRAAQLAGFKTIPAIIRDLDDKAVLEIQIVENEQREDMSPLEKSEGYSRLLELGYSVEDLAKKIGKSPATIYGLLKLRQLPEKAKKAVEKGELPMTTAQLLARIPDKKAQAAAVKFATTENHWEHELPSFRGVKRFVEEEIMTELKGAPFDTKDATLLPVIGACTTCPKRTGNNKAEWPDARPDVCTDPACFKKKVAAHKERAVAQARAAGQKVLVDKQAEDALRSYNTSYHRLNQTVGYDSGPPYSNKYSNKTYRQLLGQKLLPEQVVVAIDKEGAAHELVLKKDAAKLLPKKTASKGAADPWRQQQAKRHKAAKERTQIGRLAIAELVTGVEQRFAAVLGFTPRHVELLRALVLQTATEVWHEVRRDVLSRRRHEAPGFLGGDNERKLMKELVDDLPDARHLIGLWAELVITKEMKGSAYDSGPPKEGKALCALFGVDYTKIEREYRSTLGQKVTKAKPSKNGHVSPKRGKSARARLRKVHPELEVPEPDDEDDDGPEPVLDMQYICSMRLDDQDLELSAAAIEDCKANGYNTVQDLLNLAKAEGRPLRQALLGKKWLDEADALAIDEAVESLLQWQEQEA